MNDWEYEIRSPRTDEEWGTFHTIRRKVLFENRGKRESYIQDHPDDSKAGNHPLVLFYRDIIIGVVRVDVCERVALLRRVAIREDYQRLGHGRVLLRLAEGFANSEGCIEVKTNAAVEAVGFYESCGYARDASQLSPKNSVTMLKSLR